MLKLCILLLLYWIFNSFDSNNCGTSEVEVYTYQFFLVKLSVSIHNTTYFSNFHSTTYSHNTTVHIVDKTTDRSWISNERGEEKIGLFRSIRKHVW